MSNHIHDARERLGPFPGDDPLVRLRHTLAAHSETPAYAWAVDATSGIYDEGRTGLTFGDLSALEETIRENERARLTAPAGDPGA